MPSGYRNPYYRAINPSGGRVMEGSYPISYDAYENNPGLQAMETFRAAKKERRQQDMAEEDQQMQRAEHLYRLAADDRAIAQEERAQERIESDYDSGRRETPEQGRAGLYQYKKKEFDEGLRETPGTRRTEDLEDDIARDKKLNIPKEQREEERQKRVKRWIEDEITKPKEERDLIKDLNKREMDAQEDDDAAFRNDSIAEAKERRADRRKTKDQKEADRQWYSRQMFLDSLQTGRMQKKANIERETKRWLKKNGVDVKSSKDLSEQEKAETASLIVQEAQTLLEQYRIDNEDAQLPIGITEALENELEHLGYESAIMEDGSIGISKIKSESLDDILFSK